MCFLLIREIFTLNKKTLVVSVLIFCRSEKIKASASTRQIAFCGLWSFINAKTVRRRILMARVMVRIFDWIKTTAKGIGKKRKIILLSGIIGSAMVSLEFVTLACYVIKAKHSRV